MILAPQCNKCLAVAEMSNRLATIDMGQKLWLCPFLFWEGWGSWALADISTY